VANTTATGYSDTGLAPDTTYSYQLSAINGEGLESAKSPVVSATTAALPAPPPDPIFDDGFEEN
jgi:chitodextrinase